MVRLSLRNLSLGVSLSVVVCSGFLAAILSYSAAEKAVRSTRESGDRGIDFAFEVGKDTSTNLTYQILDGVVGQVHETVQGHLGAPLNAVSLLLRHMAATRHELYLNAAWRQEHLDTLISQTYISLSRSGVRSLSWGSPRGTRFTQYVVVGESTQSMLDAKPVVKGGFYAHAEVSSFGDGGEDICVPEDSYVWDVVDNSSELYETMTCGLNGNAHLIDTEGIPRGGDCVAYMYASLFQTGSVDDWKQEMVRVRRAMEAACVDSLNGSAACAERGLCDCAAVIRDDPSACMPNRTLAALSNNTNSTGNSTFAQLCPRTCGGCTARYSERDLVGFGVCATPFQWWNRRNTVLMVPGMVNHTVPVDSPHYLGILWDNRHLSFAIGGSWTRDELPDHPIMGKRAGAVTAYVDLKVVSETLSKMWLPRASRLALVELLYPGPAQLGSPPGPWMLVAASHGYVSDELGFPMSVFSETNRTDPVIVASARFLYQSHGRSYTAYPAWHSFPSGAGRRERCSDAPWTGPNSTVHFICHAGIRHPELESLSWLLIVTVPVESVTRSIMIANEQTRDRIRLEQDGTDSDLNTHWLTMAGIIAGSTVALMMMTAVLVMAVTKPLEDLMNGMTRLARTRMALALAAGRPPSLAANSECGRVTSEEAALTIDLGRNFSDVSITVLTQGDGDQASPATPGSPGPITGTTPGTTGQVRLPTAYLAAATADEQPGHPSGSPQSAASPTPPTFQRVQPVRSIAPDHHHHHHVAPDRPTAPDPSPTAPTNASGHDQRVSRLYEIGCLQQAFADLCVSLDEAQNTRDTAVREQLRLQVEAEMHGKVESQLREELGLEVKLKELAEQKQTDAVEAAREALLRAEAQSATARYLAHEVRNKLMPISRLLTTRSDADKDWDVAGQALELIHECLQRSLDLGKLRCGLYNISCTTFDVASQLRFVANVVQARARDEVTVAIAHDTPEELWVHTDAYLIHTVLINLASNAVKYTYNGAVIMRCELRTKAQGQNELVLTVEDTGRGIRPEALPSLFSEYRACKQQLGTGLGLPLCKSVVDALNGKITVTGNKAAGRGTVFSVLIPCRKPSEGATDGRSAVLTTQDLPQHCAVMIVDDDPTSQKVLKHRIGLAGRQDAAKWTYDIVSSGEEALSILLTPRGAHPSVRGLATSCVVMDEHMPLGGGELLGTEVIRRLRRGGYNGCIVGCSGNTIVQDHMHAGADLSWSKPPPTPRTVRRQLAQALALAERRRGKSPTPGAATAATGATAPSVPRPPEQPPPPPLPPPPPAL